MAGDFRSAFHGSSTVNAAPVAAACQLSKSDVVKGSPAIEDYAVIGDGRSIALVSRDASIDWLCWPRIDSPSLFARLVGGDAGGSWTLAPVGTHRTERRYVEGTNVLETVFETEGGAARVLDLLPLSPAEAVAAELVPEHELIRVVECTRGEIAIESVVDARPDYARTKAAWTSDAYGMRAVIRGAELRLRGETPHIAGADGILRARAVLAQGGSTAFSLSWSREAPAILPVLGGALRERLQRTIAWWREYARFEWDGPAREAVVRSKLLLKLLVYAPSGAIVAAPTTSLPEREGGDLNWDYRYCWLRDASFTLRALLATGCWSEGAAFVEWMLHSTRLTRPRLAPVYDVFGGYVPRERELDHLPGWRGSRPVRIGNGARDQAQLDVYGEVVDAASRLARRGHRIEKAAAKMLVDLCVYVANHWRDPDYGIWEAREPPRAHTSSRVMCWVALDRLLALSRDGLLPIPVPAPLLGTARAAIRRDVESAFDPVYGSYTEEPGVRKVDATLLRLSIVGFEDADSPRMRGTFAAVHRDLSAGPGLYYRYRDGRSPGEGAFGLCAFWAAAHLALAGRFAEARGTFTAAAALANDVGLFSEEYDPDTGQALGNFPQAFTHVGLVNAALTLAEGKLDDAVPTGATERHEETQP
jgi:GH15 family glucan-1,4-alpha-glucosidase